MGCIVSKLLPEPVDIEPEKYSAPSSSIKNVSSSRLSSDVGGDKEATSRPLGVSMAFIRRFLKDHPRIAAEKMSISQINKAFVKAESAGTGQSYLHKFFGQRDENGLLYIDESNIFISYAWSYEFVDVVVDVMEQCHGEDKMCYFWFDLFTNDQNSVAEKDFTWFCNTFQGSIDAIGKVVLVVAPWNNPVVLTRAWCLLEISTSLNSQNVVFEAKLPTSQVALFEAGICKDFNSVLQALADIQAENATAQNPTDLKMISEMIVKSEGGFNQVNVGVKNFLRRWYFTQAKQLGDRGDAFMMETVGNVLIRFGELAEALVFYENAVALRIQEGKDDDNGETYDNMASVFQLQGDYPKALEYYNNALTITIATRGENHVSTGNTYGNMAIVFKIQGNYPKALEYYDKALTIKIAMLGENHAETGGTYNNIANVFEKQGDYAKALEYYNKALNIKIATLGVNHKSTGDTYFNMAVLCKKDENYKQALELYTKALKAYVATLGEDHSESVDCREKIAAVKAKL